MEDRWVPSWQQRDQRRRWAAVARMRAKAEADGTTRFRSDSSADEPEFRMADAMSIASEWPIRATTWPQLLVDMDLLRQTISFRINQKSKVRRF